VPDWLSETESKGASQEVGSENFSQDDLANWLSGLDDTDKVDSKAVDMPDWREETAQPETSSAKSDLPAWMSGLDTQSDETDDEWKKSVDLLPVKPVVMRQEEIAPQTQPEPASVELSADLPDWLSAEEEPVKELAESDDDEVPEWLSVPEPEQKSAPKPTAPTDWHPVEAKPAPAQKAKPTAQPKSTQARSEPKPKAQKQPKSVAEAKPKAEPVAGQPSPEQAKTHLDRGDLPTALAHYKKLIKKGKHIEEIIRDIRESLYRYPVEIELWQMLGDAYMRANRLKEALEAYNKAAELIR
jgi:tetratricopeptide (TPR) repeat protein